jgi:hypothetical protein
VIAGLQIASFSSPFIVSEPANEAIDLGATATFSVVAGGAEPLAYQWLFNNAVIPTATNSSYGLTNAQTTNFGYYSVIVTNAYGSITSAAAVLNIVSSLIDVDFTSALVTSEMGFAAIGMNTNDFWNTCNLDIYADYASAPNLKFVDGTASGTGLALIDGLEEYGNGASDPMYASYFFTTFGYDMTMTVTNLKPGVYDFYLYGHGN